ncbi:hypothetical protein M011DRAFT_36469 [Sporormia fimetaria CBS 119925]|uniref:Uncharacterized protein n=1 Tax=Sporormia fimetaria CBS 119925 TaxID=1340428 RepID=A0A6A6VD96_9PLEO|nr:hypothetical protein M011DRAFT_36469 [Sporormia fimetaria CBS 119925]
MAFEKRKEVTSPIVITISLLSTLTSPLVWTIPHPSTASQPGPILILLASPIRLPGSCIMSFTYASDTLRTYETLFLTAPSSKDNGATTPASPIANPRSWNPRKARQRYDIFDDVQDLKWRIDRLALRHDVIASYRESTLEQPFLRWIGDANRYGLPGLWKGEEQEEDPNGPRGRGESVTGTATDIRSDDTSNATATGEVHQDDASSAAPRFSWSATSDYTYVMTRPSLEGPIAQPRDSLSSNTAWETVVDELVSRGLVTRTSPKQSYRFGVDGAMDDGDTEFASELAAIFNGSSSGDDTAQEDPIHYAVPPAPELPSKSAKALGVRFAARSKGRSEGTISSAGGDHFSSSSPFQAWRNQKWEKTAKMRKMRRAFSFAGKMVGRSEA